MSAKRLILAAAFAGGLAAHGRAVEPRKLNAETARLVSTLARRPAGDPAAKARLAEIEAAVKEYDQLRTALDDPRRAGEVKRLWETDPLGFQARMARLRRYVKPQMVDQIESEVKSEADEAMQELLACFEDVTHCKT
ncbi:MAG: hypothetical protein HY554_03725 [Elusimicrobia bacterium]|nr:hypothetical protein [Elusimicrobiota bacterium]